MGLAVSSIIANIYMGYFEEMAIGPEWSIPCLWWKRYLDYVIRTVKKNQVDTFFSNLNSADPHIKFTMESLGTDSSI